MPAAQFTSSMVGRLAVLRDSLRDGDWAVPARLRAYALMILGASVLGLAGLLATSDGTRDLAGRPLGTDFSQVWVAGRAVLAGHPDAPFDPATHAAAQRAAFGSATPFYGWHYPPYFLGLAALLATMPYGAALALWQGATLPLFLAVVWTILRLGPGGARIAGRDILLAAAAFPAVLVNVTHGHNGFLTAALMGFGCVALPRRPLLAGLLFGCLAYKPQFALVLPVALVAARAWRAAAAAVATVVVLTAGTLAAFGTATWRAFAESLPFTRHVVLEQGNTGWEKIQSPFAAARMLGLGIDAAYAVQGTVTVTVLAAVALAWRSAADDRAKAGLLMVGSLLTTPYCLDYDMTLLGPALAFLVALALRTGWRPWEKTIVAAAWVAPGVVRGLGGTLHLPLGAPLMLLVFAMLLARCRSGASARLRMIPNAPSRLGAERPA